MLSSLIEKYKRYSLKLVVLFGSRARGDYTNESDVDLLIVADNLVKDPRESFIQLYDPVYPLVNPIGLNTETFLKKLEEGSTFILEILEDGKILYADTEFLQEVMNSYEEVRRRYARKGRTWMV
ncbi:MAG: nucleotidyltransferase domain-containing protein [Zestosphaera sp.]